MAAVKRRVIGILIKQKAINCRPGGTGNAGAPMGRIGALGRLPDRP
jgi:hypothetical protein